MSLGEEKLTRSLEEYLEAIYSLKLSGKTPRVKAIAKAMGVKLSSVTDAVRRLADLGFLDYERYGDIKLTEKGEAVARAIYNREKLMYKFLREMLMVDDEIALKDACRMEHDLSKETIDNLTSFMEFLEKECGDELKLRFARYLEAKLKG